MKESNWLEAAQLSDKMGFCYLKAAFQAEAYPEFRERIKLAVGSWKKGSNFLRQLAIKTKRDQTCKSICCLRTILS